MDTILNFYNTLQNYGVFIIPVILTYFLTWYFKNHHWDLYFVERQIWIAKLLTFLTAIGLSFGLVAVFMLDKWDVLLYFRNVIYSFTMAVCSRRVWKLFLFWKNRKVNND